RARPLPGLIESRLGERTEPVFKRAVAAAMNGKKPRGFRCKPGDVIAHFDGRPAEAQDFEGRVARIGEPARADIEDERQRRLATVDRREEVRLPWTDRRRVRRRKGEGFAVDDHAGGRT